MLPDDAPEHQARPQNDTTFEEALTVAQDAATITVGSAGPIPSAAAGDLPESIGRYRILGKLGEGGMGIVYEAEQQDPKRRVALKVVRGGRFVDESSLRMFRREAETLARLRHPNIGAIYESGRTEDGQHFFAMELVQGHDLGAFLANRPRALVPAEMRLRLSLFQRIAEAVHYAHQRGVIHRDLKPSNIIVTDETTSESSVASLSGVRVPEVKILDFGLARITEGDVQMTLATEVGAIKGTLPYMAPEQARGNPEAIDVRTDVYALGVILYEMLAGTRPYDVSRGSLIDAVRVICEEPPRSLRTTMSGTRRLDPDVETIVGKALAKDADHRYASAAAMAEDVGRYLANQPILARPPSTVYQLRKFAGRNRALVSGVAATFLVLVAGVAVSSFQAVRATRAEALATSRMARAERAEALAQRRHREAEQARGLAEERRADAERQRAAAVRERGRALRARTAAERARAAAEEARNAETEQRWAAESSAREAGLEAEKARAVSGFLQDMLATADPWSPTGGKVTLDAALDRARTRVSAGAIPDPEVDYAIRGTLASAFAGVGRYPDAEELLRGGIARPGGELTPPVMVAGLHRQLGEVLLRSSRYADAEREFRLALDGQRLTAGATGDTSAMMMGDLAGSLAYQGRYAEADSVARQAFALAREVGLGTSQAAPGILRTRAYIESHGNGDRPAADALLRASLALLDSRAGDHALEKAEARQELAALRIAAGDLAGADSLYRATLPPAEADGAGAPMGDPAATVRRALSLQQRALGPEALPVGRTWIALAGVYAATSRLRESQAAFESGLAVLRRSLGDGHPDLAAPLIEFAMLRTRQGRLGDAEALAREALRIRLERSGPGAPATMEAQMALADVLTVRRTRKSLGEAQSLLASAIAGANARGDANDPRAIEATRALERLREPRRRRSGGPTSQAVPGK